MVDEYSIWLLSTEAQQQELTSLVHSLAARYGSEPFIPHVTIQGDIKRPLAEIEPAIAAMASRWPAQRWPISAVDGTEFFFRSLFLRFDETPAYADCKAIAREHNATADGLSLFPHLSLAYGLTGTAQTDAITGLLDRTGNELLFDRVVIARSSSGVPIKDWAVLSSITLSA